MWPNKRTPWQELADETEAFLAGRLAEQMEGRGEAVPVWSWTNLLAHGSDEDLRVVARAAPTPGYRPEPGDRWRAARSYLAAEVSYVAARCPPLVQLQSELLVPLELDLASRPEVDWWLPSKWVKVVLGRLVEHGLRHRRSAMHRELIGPFCAGPGRAVTEAPISPAP
jgi:hypothetical protein